MNLDPATRARLVGIFVAETREEVGLLRGLLSRAADGGDEDALGAVGRTVHGLKGAAASLGYDALARALHGLEDLAMGMAGQAEDARRVQAQRVGAALDAIEEGAARMGAGGSDGFPEDLLGRLVGIVATSTRPTPAPLAPAAPSPTSTHAPALERISVPATDVDAALRLASSLARSAARLSERLQPSGGEHGGPAQSLAAGAAGLEALVAGLRLLPADAALSGLEEEIQGLAGQLGKRVGLAITGRDVRADRRTLQAARGMIRHLVRNALDHGIEPPADRASAGKPAEGRVGVAVEVREATLRVVVADDGAGFDAPAIRRELARRTGDDGSVASLSDEEALRRWAFEGGSTRASATQISGRGLGLSAVAQLARAAGGGIRVQSVRGEGSLVEFTLPLEVYAVEALSVVAAGRTFAIPLAAVERVVHLAAADGAVHDGPGGRTLAVGETILPLGTLGGTLGAGPVPREERFAVVVRSEGTLAALAVDEVGAVEGMVPSPVPGVAEADALVTGVARLPDGGGAAVLNPRLLVARAREARAGAPARAAADAPRALEVLLAEDSLATREVLRVLLEGQGFKVRVAADGEEALERVAERAPDVLVSDVNMPRRDGLSLARALRARAGTERLPIVLLTSQDDDETRAAGAAAGADAYLLKSRFNAEVLREALARIGVRTR